ncbi:hypothetical protein [Bradyrhizobium sp. LA2.1]|uniref:hypothetical protein n=1 Tax=Bradyrhizobium sp. LA2.1 TaxID=3156376 RepID=UPI00339582E2
MTFRGKASQVDADGSDLCEIRELAAEFREAIERCPRERLPITFADCPRGACGDATLLLAKHLERNGHTGFVYVLGMRNGGSHAWLRRGALIVDITADQFEDHFQPVVVDTTSNWHATFDLDPDDQQHPTNFEEYDEATVVTLANAYVEQVPR